MKLTEVGIKKRILELIVEQCTDMVEEVFGDVRKGVPQSRYVVKIDHGSTYTDWEKDPCKDTPVPDTLIGHWMNPHDNDLRHIPIRESLSDLDAWVQCKPVEVTSINWIEF